MNTLIEIKEISEDEFEQLMNTGFGKVGEYKPIGSFLYKSNGSFTAVDNTNGNAYTESFDNKVDAVAYLLGSDVKCIDVEAIGFMNAYNLLTEIAKENDFFKTAIIRVAEDLTFKSLV